MITQDKNWLDYVIGNIAIKGAFGSLITLKKGTIESFEFPLYSPGSIHLIIVFDLEKNNVPKEQISKKYIQKEFRKTKLQLGLDFASIVKCELDQEDVFEFTDIRLEKLDNNLLLKLYNNLNEIVVFKSEEVSLANLIGEK